MRYRGHTSFDLSSFVARLELVKMTKLHVFKKSKLPKRSSVIKISDFYVKSHEYYYKSMLGF